MSMRRWTILMGVVASIVFVTASRSSLATPVGLYYWDGVSSTLISSSNTQLMSSSGSNAYVYLEGNTLHQFSSGALSFIDTWATVESLVGSGNGTGYIVAGTGGNFLRLSGTSQNTIDAWGNGRLDVTGAGSGLGYMLVDGTDVWYLNGGTGLGGQNLVITLGSGVALLEGAGNGAGYAVWNNDGRIVRHNGASAVDTIDIWGLDGSSNPRVQQLVGAGGSTGTAYFTHDNGVLRYLNGGIGTAGQSGVIADWTGRINQLVGAGADNGYLVVDADNKMYALSGSTQVLYDTWGTDSDSVVDLFGGIESGGFAYMTRANGQLWQIGGTTTAGETLMGTFTPGEIGEVVGLSDGTALYTVVLRDQAVWNAGTGDWSTAYNWANAFVPNANNVTTIFGSAITTAETVFADSAVTTKVVQFDSANSYVIAGTGSVELTADSGNASISVLQGLHQFQVAVNLNSATDVSVGSGATLTFNNVLNMGVNNLTKTGAGMLQINNALNTGTGMLNAIAGTVSGVGLVSNDLNNTGATVAPGNSAGTLSVGGDYTQETGASLAIEIGGVAAGSEYDLLNVTGSLTINGGPMNVVLINGFEPRPGDTFDVLNFGSTSGAFSAVNLPVLSGSGRTWDGTQLLVDGSLSITGILGDMDGDGSLTTADVPLFVQALVNRAVYDANGFFVNADFTGDVDQSGTFDLGDLSTFGALSFSATASASASSIPEPGSASLVIMILSVLALVDRRRTKW